MKTKRKELLIAICTAIIFYFVGAILGFPLIQNKMLSGNIKNANGMQQSSADAFFSQKFTSDADYRNKMINSFEMMYTQTKTVISTIDSLKRTAGSVEELNSYVKPMNAVTEVGNKLLPLLKNTLGDLRDLSENKPVNDISMKLAQSLNMFQIMNSRIADLEEFTSRTEELFAQKMLNDNILENYSKYLEMSTDIAMACGDKARAEQNTETSNKINKGDEKSNQKVSNKPQESVSELTEMLYQ